MKKQRSVVRRLETPPAPSDMGRPGPSDHRDRLGDLLETALDDITMSEYQRGLILWAVDEIRRLRAST